METVSYLPVNLTRHDRSRELLDHCQSLHLPPDDISHRTGLELARKHPLLHSVIYPVQSKSLIYCAVPKVATKTLLTLILYIHLLNIREHLNTNSGTMNTDNKIREQTINLPTLVHELRKQGIQMSPMNNSISITSFIETYLYLFRSGSINATSASPYLNPWRLNLREAFPQNQLSALPTLSKIFSPSFTRVIFVRHPFERLASAYKERIALLDKDRVESEPEYDRTRKTICNQFTRLHAIRPSSMAVDWCDNVIPSFEDFVRFILQSLRKFSAKSRLDYHWQPYSMICQVCKFKYNFIGKYETFHDDFNRLLKHLNISDWNIDERKGASGFSRLDYQQMYSSLSDELICGIKNLYADDLRLFDYRLEDYVQRSNLVCHQSKSDLAESNRYQIHQWPIHNRLKLQPSADQLRLQRLKYSKKAIFPSQF